MNVRVYRIGLFSELVMLFRGCLVSLLDLRSFIHIKGRVKRETHEICQGKAEERGKETPKGPLETWI